MNLFDLLKRSDRSVSMTPEGAVEGCYVKSAHGLLRAVRLAAGARLRLADVHAFTAFDPRTRTPGWTFWAEGGPARLHIRAAGGGETMALFAGAAAPDAGPAPIALNWRASRALATAYDLEFEAQGEGAVTIAVGPGVDMRAAVLPLAFGIGAEVGPGIAPSVLPTETCDVRYVEASAPEDWLALYEKGGDRRAPPPPEVLERYVIGSAVSLDLFAPASLDFIFSNHVFEHLPNPVRVLRNWMTALKPGGVIIGVTPDPRYSFDARQPITTVEEALREAAEDGHTIPPAKYERWIRWTEPRTTVESLIARNYSIHVNYFTPETFAALAERLREAGEMAQSTVISAQNNKDFAFALWKPD